MKRAWADLLAALALLVAVPVALAVHRWQAIAALALAIGACTIALLAAWVRRR